MHLIPQYQIKYSSSLQPVQIAIALGFSLPWSLVLGFMLCKPPRYVVEPHTKQSRCLLQMDMQMYPFRCKVTKKTEHQIYNRFASGIWRSIHALHDDLALVRQGLSGSVESKASVNPLTLSSNCFRCEEMHAMWARNSRPDTRVSVREMAQEDRPCHMQKLQLQLSKSCLFKALNKDLYLSNPARCLFWVLHVNSSSSPFEQTHTRF